MIVFSDKYPGRILICQNCGALLGAIKDSDIYGENIWCPLCKSANKIDYNKDYDGIVKNPKNSVENAKES